MRGKEDNLALYGRIQVNDVDIYCSTASFAWSEEAFYRDLRSKIGTDAVEKILLGV